MAYELYYGLVMTSSAPTPMARFERWGFMVWFVMDATFAAVAIYSAYPRKVWGRMMAYLVGGVIAGVGVLRWVATVWPDEREQVTAYWTGIVLQVPISWGSLILLVKRRNTKGHSLEIWCVLNRVIGERFLIKVRITRYLGCYAAYGVFVWRYLNAPQNWAYVNSFWSWFIILSALFAETFYPLVYVWAHVQSVQKEVVKSNGMENGKEKDS